MATMTIEAALAHADVHAVPGHAQSVLAAEVRRLRAENQKALLQEPFAYTWEYFGTHFTQDASRFSQMENVGPRCLYLLPFDPSALLAEIERLRAAAVDAEDLAHIQNKKITELAAMLRSTWYQADHILPDLSEDVLVTILTDGTDTDWRAGFWDGEYWHILDTEIDEPVQVNAGCNFVVTHWKRVNPAKQGLTDE